jgi:hypothetical protein
MASERQIAANRANSRKSAGPKSRSGKSRASQNAYRHGLAARKSVDASWIDKVELLASEIVISTAGLVDLVQAGLIARAELEVQRVRATITATISQTFAGGDHKGRGAAITSSIQRALSTLRILDRYERRAIARRDKLIRTFFET